MMTDMSSCVLLPLSDEATTTDPSARPTYTSPVDMPLDVGETLTEIKVGIEQLRGEVNTGFAKMAGEASAHAQQLERHDGEIKALRGDVDSLKSTRDVSRGRAMGIAAAAAAISSGGTAGILKLISVLAS